MWWIIYTYNPYIIYMMVGSRPIGYTTFVGTIGLFQPNVLEFHGVWNGSMNSRRLGLWLEYIINGNSLWLKYIINGNSLSLKYIMNGNSLWLKYIINENWDRNGLIYLCLIFYRNMFIIESLLLLQNQLQLKFILKLKVIFFYKN